MLAAGGAVAVVVAGAVACQPVEGELDTVTVAATTDSQATQELNRTHGKVAWISCTAAWIGRAPSGGSTPDEVKVDCRGRTRDGKDIRIEGWIYGVVPGKCVRGTTIARVDNKVWFRLQVLGNCAALSTSQPTYTYTKPSNKPQPQQPAPRSTQPGGTRTVIETVTQTVRVPDPNCSCFEGK
ncbi:hypothetical protein [Streptomyces sp. NPDC016845]|uniref:hypothetical protein n=1 Tax=Streptomyces sp. NPDC016845 TaxID=3364972 RepID=UPI00378A8F3A